MSERPRPLVAPSRQAGPEMGLRWGWSGGKKGFRDVAFWPTANSVGVDPPPRTFPHPHPLPSPRVTRQLDPMAPLFGVKGWKHSY